MKIKKINKFLKFSEKEITDLTKAWAAISVAFAIVISGFSISILFIYSILISGFTVGLGFLLHELAHKYLAQKYGCIAEFRSNDNMLILALIMSFFGFIFAAPGGVFIHGYIGKVRYGKISAAGIFMNILLASLFGILYIFSPFKTIANYGLFINALLAGFNLIPIFNFDGKKVLSWNKTAYFTLLIAAISLIFLSQTAF